MNNRQYIAFWYVTVCFLLLLEHTRDAHRKYNMCKLMRRKCSGCRLFKAQFLFTCGMRVMFTAWTSTELKSSDPNKSSKELRRLAMIIDKNYAKCDCTLKATLEIVQIFMRTILIHLPIFSFHHHNHGLFVSLLDFLSHILS